MNKNGKMILAAMLVMMVVAGGFLSAGGSKEAAPAKDAGLSGTFTFGGSTTVQPIANGVAEAMMAANPKLKITYEGVGSGTGLKQLAAGTLSMAGSSRDLKQAELDGGLVPVVIAKDGIAIVVNKDVTVANLAKDQVAKIFSGEITNWKDVGGKDEKIEIINRDEASGTYASFKEIILDPTKLAFSKTAIVAKENGEVAAKVASTPGAIGYVGLGFVDEITKSGGKALSIDGVAVSSANVVNGTYSISRNLYVATKGAMVAGSVEDAFVKYALSAKGSIIVKEAGFVPVK